MSEWPKILEKLVYSLLGDVKPSRLMEILEQLIEEVEDEEVKETLWNIWSKLDKIETAKLESKIRRLKFDR